MMKIGKAYKNTSSGSVVVLTKIHSTAQGGNGRFWIKADYHCFQDKHDEMAGYFIRDNWVEYDTDGENLQKEEVTHW
jgi:hypothetical protein